MCPPLPVPAVIDDPNGPGIPPAREGGALRHPVVLMHNQPVGNPATVAALPVIIRFFRAHGCRFVRL